MNEDMNNNNANNNALNNANNNANNANETNQDNRFLQLEDSEKDESVLGNRSVENPNGDHQEETAAEFAPTRGLVGERPFADDVDEETADGNAVEGRGVGAFAIVLSIISLFFLPVILGAAGIIVGFIARRNKATALGNSAIGIGAISIILTLFFSPFF